MADLIIDVYQGSNRKCLVIGNHRISTGKAYGYLEKVESYRCDTKYILSCIGNVNRWIPCSERLPEYGLDVLVYTKSWEEHIQVAHIQYDGIMWELSDGEFYFSQSDVSHWMPLPEPPEVAQDE